MSEPTLLSKLATLNPPHPCCGWTLIPPQLPVKMVAADARKTATGQIIDHIELIVPSHWSNRFAV
ncbi:MAG: hypothetical protein R2857_11535 [Vampirovibrionales bacterium]